ncbi:MAG: urea transporter [Burkholderiales bacterium]|nr:urea transporter [Burkholderiales bacterium]
MKGLLAWWEGRCAASKALRFIDVNLRGIGQVMFQDNPLSGLLFFVAIGWGSYAAGVPEIAIGGLVAVVASTLTTYWLRVDETSLKAGLYGFNGYLVGLALATFMTPSTTMWVYVIFGSAVSVVAMLAIANVCKTWGVPALTAPFVLVTWLLLLATYAFSGLEGGALPPVGEIVPIDPAAADPLRFGDFVSGTFTSITQVFLKGHGPAAVLLLAGLAVSSVASAVFAVVGALVGVVVAHLLGAESELVTAGLLGFNPVLTAIALGAVFYRPGLRVVVYTLVATVLSVIVQGTMMTFLAPFGIPTLTGTFVLVTWLFLLPGLKFE